MKRKLAALHLEGFGTANPKPKLALTSSFGLCAAWHTGRQACKGRLILHCYSPATSVEVCSGRASTNYTALVATTPVTHNNFHLHPCRREEVADVFATPLLELVYHAATVHRMYNDPSMVC